MKEENKDIPKYKEKQSIDILNEGLYHKNKEHIQRKRRKIHDREINLENDFDDDFDEFLKKRKKRVLPASLFKKVFFVTLFFFVVTAAVAAFSLYEGKKEVSDDLISMEILAQPFVDGGEPLELKVRVQNFNERGLQSPDLVLSYPKDSSTEGGEIFLRRSLEDINQEQRVDEDFNINLFGQEGDIRKIKAVLEYRIEDSSSIFIKEVSHELVIRSTPTQLSINGPKTLVENQEIILEVDLASNSTKQLNDILLSMNYPLGFEFISSNIPAQFGSHTWHFPNLTNEKKSLKITGKLSALPGQGQSFHAKLGRQDASQKNRIETVFNTGVHSVDIEESFVAINMQLDKEEGDIVIRAGDMVDVQVSYENTLGVTLADVQIVAEIDGDLYKQEGVFVSSGNFDSNTNQVTWNKNSLGRLEFLEPGESGNMTISIPTHKLVTQTGSIENPSFNIQVNVSATEVNGTLRQALSVASGKVSANSDLRLLAKTLHYSGPFKNTGQIPPRVGRDSQYTITLQATNSSNDISDSKVITFLPPYVTWTGNIAPSVERQNVSYNETTREVMWEIGTLKSGVGVNDSRPKQVSFQVSVLPSLSHVGSDLKLTNDIILSGKDTFTNTNLSFRKSPVSTRLHQDPSAESSDGRVKK